MRKLLYGNKASINKNRVILTAIILLCFLSLASAEKAFYPKVEIIFEKPHWWSIFFNDIWPKTSFTYTINNIGSANDIDVNEGLLILEIAEDEGLGNEPRKDKFQFFSYAIFDTVKPGKEIKLKFFLSETYKIGRFRIKPTLFVYPKDKSPLKIIREKMKQQGIDVYRAWENLFFQNWRNNLEAPLGTLSIEGGSDLIINRSFFKVYSITGVTGVTVIGLLLWIGRKFIRKKGKSKRKTKSK